MAAVPRSKRTRYVLDSAGLLEAVNVNPSECATTDGVLSEVRPGGATGRRADYLLAAGLEVAQPSEAARRRVADASGATGAAARLSPVDAEVLALALDRGATLITDDYTVQDMAQRLGVAWQAAATRGIRDVVAWQARCDGCGRLYELDRAGGECDVCGSAIRSRRRAK